MFIKRALVASLAVAACAAPAGANVQVGSSGWEWGNPLPQGNTLRAMSFAGTTGYAAGEFGTLLKTTDGGATWSGLRVGTFESLAIVQALDADTVVAGGGCVARRSLDGGATFTAIAFAAVESRCRAPLRDLAFVTADVGFLLLADGSVYATTDGGTQFAPRTAVPGTQAAGGRLTGASLAFTNETTGYAAAGDRIYRTLDAGVSWTLVAQAADVIEQLRFVDAEHGFAVGHSRLFLRTVDGGATWAPRDLGGSWRNFMSIDCADAQLCVMTTHDGSALVRTTDAGETPGTTITPATDPIYAAAFASPARVAAAGANGATVRSDDAGATFARIGGRLAGRFSALRAGGAPGTAYAVGEGGALAITADGGRSWTRGAVPTSADLHDVSFPTASVGYALDRDGGVFRTANGGDTWKTLGSGSARRPWVVLAPTADAVLLVGPRGIRRSGDGGETFVQLRSRAVAGARLFDGHIAGDGSLFAWGWQRLVRSSDGGRRWTRLRLPAKQIAQAAFSSSRAGFVRDTAGRVWRTTSAGRRWNYLATVGTARVRGLASASPSEAFLTIDRFGDRAGGFLLHTVDGGRTWQPQFVVNLPIAPYGIATAREGGPAYLLAGDAALLSSRSGGSAGERSSLTLTTKRRMLRRGRTITVTGRLRPAGGVAQVVVSARRPGSRWVQQTVTVAANGTFASRWRVRRGTTTFVAQWTGDFTSAGAGSHALVVEVRPRRADR